jgi:hypothetical protein
MSEGNRAEVELTMPAHPSTMLLARLQVAGVGRLLDLGADDVADLRLAIEELCLGVLAQASDGHDRLALQLCWDDAAISASCALLRGDGAASDGWVDVGSRELSSQILGALVDEHGTDDGPRAWFRKKRAMG